MKQLINTENTIKDIIKNQEELNKMIIKLQQQQIDKLKETGYVKTIFVEKNLEIIMEELESTLNANMYTFLGACHSSLRNYREEIKNVKMDAKRNGGN